MDEDKIKELETYIKSYGLAIDSNMEKIKEVEQKIEMLRSDDSNVLANQDDHIRIIESVVKDIINKFSHFSGWIHDAISTDCLVPPERSPALQSSLITLFLELEILGLKLLGEDQQLKKICDKTDCDFYEGKHYICICCHDKSSHEKFVYYKKEKEPEVNIPLPLEDLEKLLELYAHDLSELYTSDIPGYDYKSTRGYKKLKKYFLKLIVGGGN